MKKNPAIKSALLVLSVALLSLGSCKKENILLDNELEFAKLEAIDVVV